MPNYSDFAHHLDLTKEAISTAKIAFLPGDPDRVAKISSYLEEPKELASKREFRTHIGKKDGVEVLVVSTGGGAPSVSVVVEELAQLGIEIFVRVGSTGAIQPNIAIGELVISNAAVRLEGASKSFAPIEYPAVSNLSVTNALISAAVSKKIKFHTGITASTDTFYQGQERYDTFSGFVPAHLRGSLKDLQAIQVLNYEMEAALLFTMCGSMGLKSGCICGVVANRSKSEDIASIEEFEESEKTVSLVAIESTTMLARLLT